MGRLAFNNIVVAVKLFELCVLNFVNFTDEEQLRV